LPVQLVQRRRDLIDTAGRAGGLRVGEQNTHGESNSEHFSVKAASPKTSVPPVVPAANQPSAA
jgi:hypothetical protein